MSTAYRLDVGSLTTTYCGVQGCGIAFAIPTSMYNQRRDDGGLFYCPNGHNICFTDSKTDKLRKQLAQKQKQLEWAEQATTRVRAERDRAERSRNAARGVTTKLKNRFAKGLCPHCAATFPNLAKHIQAMHGADKEG